MTHDKTLKTMALAIFYSVVISIGLSCATKLPGSPDIITENQSAFALDAQCYADYFKLGTVTVYFTDEERKFPCGIWGEEDGGQMCSGAAWAYPYYDKIAVWTVWLETADRSSINYTAAHEVCHLTGIISHNQAHEKCVLQAIQNSGCYK